MDREQRFDGLDLQNDAVFDEEIDSITAVEEDVLFVPKGNGDFTLDDDFSMPEFPAETFLISRFEESRSQLSMHLDRGTKNPSCEVSVDEHASSSAGVVP